MKALILAAGEGTRLRPITNTVPKVLVPIGGRPLLDIHFDQLKKAGVADVLINTHWLPEPVRDFSALHRTKDFNITLIHEPRLLGSAGTFFASRDFFKDDPHIAVVYGDNFSDISYRELLTYHIDTKSVATVVCTEVENIRQKGMVIIGVNDRITGFKEKPSAEEAVSRYANSGIYIFDRKIFEYLEPLARAHADRDAVMDFGKDVFPWMLKKNIPINAYLFKGFLIDIGDHTAYAVANERIKKT